MDPPAPPPLNDDIVGRILSLCPTFSTLESANFVSQAFRRVFQTHPQVSHSRLRSPVYVINLVSP
jgi:hypothetical protein